MIRALLRLHWLGLRRDRMALVLAFVLPLAFFSIMTRVMAELTSVMQVGKVELGIVDHDDSATTRRIIAQLRARDEFAVQLITARDADGVDAQRLLRRTGVNAIAVFPPRFEAMLLAGGDTPARVELWEDRANPIYAGILANLLETALAGMGQMAQIAAAMPAGANTVAPAAAVAARPLVVDRIDVFGQRVTPGRDVTVSYWAAGTGVLFLLFSMAGSGAGLLEEEESGILERMVTAGVPLWLLLLCKWLFAAALGCAQVTAMFVWGWLLFGVELFEGNHLSGFLAMTLATALAASALGMLLATASRSRAQLAGVSTVLILVMSALGGSMFPRFLMSPALKEVGMVTFNAWALDGYQKVFWYEAPLRELWPQLGVLTALSLLFIALAIVLAGRRLAR